MRLLTDKPFRQRLLTHVADPAVRAFWETEFGPWPPKFKAEAIAPIQNKIGPFLWFTEKATAVRPFARVNFGTETNFAV